MSRIWFDTEFIDTGAQIHLLSIGCVRDDGATYAEPGETDLMLASDWVRQNVLPHLGRCQTVEGTFAYAVEALERSTKPRTQIADELIEFAGMNPEWWGYMADYDWVVLSQLYGPLVNRPAGWGFWCHDVMQLAETVGVVPGDIPQENEHQALADAMWTKRVWEACHEKIVALECP